MPSPLGHALAGATAGLAINGLSPGAGPSGAAFWRTTAVFAICGMLPDLDLVLASVHRGPSHSLAAAVVVGIVAAWWGRRFGLAAGAAYATHILLDWLGTDSSAPIGLMALWPMTTAYYQSSLHLFDAISRRYWVDGFVAHNVRAVAKELLILLPPAIAVALSRSRQRS
jgi:inner membrane protein